VARATTRSSSSLARHRAVYAAVGDMIPAEIHALSIRALTPEEWRAQA
jgi:BolA protein